MSNTSITYDDTSDQIKYTGPWYPLRQNPRAYNHTYTGVNEHASFAFSFFGSQVSVYGILRNENYSVSVATSSVYSIDNNAVFTYTGSMGNTSVSDVQFFNSSGLNESEHLLVVNVTSATNSFPYYLDYIIVSLPSTNTSGPSGSLTATSVLPVPSSRENDAHPAASHTVANSIVGSVAGGMLLLCIVFGSLFFWRRARKNSGSPHDDRRGGINGATPFMLPGDHFSSSMATSPLEISSPLSTFGTPHVVRNQSRVGLLRSSNPFASPPLEDAAEGSSDPAWSIAASRAASISDVSNRRTPRMSSPRHSHASRKGYSTTGNGSTVALLSSILPVQTQIIITAPDGTDFWDGTTDSETLPEVSTFPPVYTRT